MIRLMSPIVVLVLMALVMSASPVNAEYVKNGAAVCLAQGDQYNPSLICTGPGSTIIVWQDYRNGDCDIYAQRLDSTGVALWADGGVAICTATGDQSDPQIVSDDAGGGIIAWNDRRSGAFDIYAQRIDANGTPLWAPNGTPVCALVRDQAGPRIAEGGEPGGAIITWNDNRTNLNNCDIYAQAIDGDGNILWSADGVPICTADGSQYNPVIISDGAAGAFIAWDDYRIPECDVYVQRINGSGVVQWEDDGLAVCSAEGFQGGPRLVSGPSSGVIVAWIDNRNLNYDIYAQWVNGDGDTYWTLDGVAVADSDWHESLSSMVSDGAGGAIFFWTDNREGASGIYAQRMNDSGNMIWLWSGVPISVVPEWSEAISAIPDGNGGAIIALADYRRGYGDIYAERVDATGEILWTRNGVSVCTAPMDQLGCRLAPDFRGGAIIAWRDVRNGSHYDIYAQRVREDGLWGNPEPAIASCLDVPKDQGGWVRITVKASSHDIKQEQDYPITGYNVWREISSLGAAGRLEAEGVLKSGDVPAIDLLAKAVSTPGVRISRAQAMLLGFPEGDWESIGFHAAKQDTVYYFTVPTRNDSTASDIPWETYMVTAHTPVPSTFIVSNADSAYSVDNLAPGITGGFAGTQSLAPPGLRLSWSENVAADLASYRIHWGPDDAFVPDESNLLGTTADTTYNDPGWAPGYFYYYKLVALDRHGNRSSAALLRPEDVKVGTLLTNCAASCSGSAIEVTWRLSEAAAGMYFVVLRACGPTEAFIGMPNVEIKRDRLSFSFHDSKIEPGSTYRYRVDLYNEGGRSVLFETQAISTPVMPITLYQNRPNPFNPSTAITYHIPDRYHVRLAVYDSSGRPVARLVDALEEKGFHSIEWNGRDEEGRSVASGVYFYRLVAGKHAISKKMMLIR